MTLRVAEVGQAAADSVIEASDWVTLDAVALARRLYGSVFDTLQRPGIGHEAYEDFGERASDVTAGGQITARIAIPTLLHGRDMARAVVTVGGMRAGYVYGFAGILEGQPDRAARDAAIPTLDSATAREWARSQLESLDLGAEPLIERFDYAGTFGAFSVISDELPICVSKDGLLSSPEIADWASRRSEALIGWWQIFDYDVAESGSLSFYEYQGAGRTCAIDVVPDLLMVQGAPIWISEGIEVGHVSGRRWPEFDLGDLAEIPEAWQSWWQWAASLPLFECILRQVAAGWATSLADLLAAAELFKRDEEITVGTTDDGDEVRWPIIIRLRRSTAM